MVALVLALTGAAVAGQAAISALTGGEKKTVKKIAKTQANKRITALAPSLSVRSAESANTAKTADTANTANGLVGDYYAVVNPNGTLARGTANVSSQRALLGQYYVSIDRNVAPCFYIATLGGTPTADTNGQIAALPDPGFSANAVFVVTHDIAGSTADRTFTLHIRC